MTTSCGENNDTCISATQHTVHWIKSTGGKLFLGRFPFKFTSGVHLSVCSSLYVGSVCKYGCGLLRFLPSSPNDLLNCRDHWHDAAEPSTCHVCYLNTKTTWKRYQTLIWIFIKWRFRLRNKFLPLAHFFLVDSLICYMMRRPLDPSITSRSETASRGERLQQTLTLCWN